MDESLSWRARFAKSNINILNITMVRTDHGVIYRWFVEFTYHPNPGTFKWCKTYIDISPDIVHDDEAPEKWFYREPSTDEMAQEILGRVLELRKELER